MYEHGISADATANVPYPAASDEQKGSVSPESEDVAGRLPGLVRLFRAQLWLGILSGIAGAGWIMCVLLFSSRSLGPLWLMLSAFVLFLAACGLCFWVDSAIGARSPEAPDRCRVLAGLNIGLSGLVLAGIWLGKLAGVLDAYVPQLLEVTWPLLLGMIWSEGWRRYFAESPRVRVVFRLDEAASGHWREPTPAPDAVTPGELGLFQVLCWSAFVWYGLAPAVFLLSNYEHLVVEFRFFAITGSTLTGLTLPLIAAFAVKERGERLLFWCLGLWIGSFVLLYAAMAIGVSLDLMGQESRGWNRPRGAVRLSPFFEPRLLLGLVFWWYLTSSARAKAWFRAAR